MSDKKFCVTDTSNSTPFVWTVLPYMYRDADNYKTFRDIYLIGRLSDDDKQVIYQKFEDKQFFLPADVGLDDLQPNLGKYDEETDHIWHELLLDEAEIHESETPPANIDFDESVDAFVRKFRELDGWDESAAIDALEEWGESCE